MLHIQLLAASEKNVNEFFRTYDYALVSSNDILRTLEVTRIRGDVPRPEDGYFISRILLPDGRHKVFIVP